MILPFEVEDAEGGSKRDVLLGGVVGDLQDQTMPRQDVVLLAEASRPTTWGVDSGHNEDVLKFFRRYPRRGRAHPLQREWRDGLLLQRC